ncbi:mannitol dehydrogenase family protein [Paracoccaceae bacterium]|nr:mannitol dehydrogenase family protein [Paracoccaceae bacterium]
MNSILSESELKKLPRPIRKETTLTSKIIHFGPGAFFRSFVASLIEDINQRDVEKWGIIAVSLNSENTFNKLSGQDLVFDALSMSGRKKQVHQISSISNFFVAKKERQSVLNALADEQIEIVSLTITEKGYHYNSDKKELDFSNQNIIDDLENLENPKTAVGFLVAGLRDRYLNGKVPFTILSCDNLQNNGAVAKKIVIDFAKKIDSSFAKWISKEVSFPSSMVDRITPATKEQDIIDFAEEHGVYDPALVVHEEFFQWVIEDKFSSVRPKFELAGIQIVSSVELHEKMKLRCLNGTHSALAYLGYLAGCNTIAECVSHDSMVNYIQYLWGKEIIPTLETPEGENLNVYCNKLVERYQNPAIEHRTWQIAMDGSQKLPQRVLETVSDLLKHQGNFQGLALAIAAWIKYVTGIDLNGETIDVRDPLAKDFAMIAKKSKTSENYVDSILDQSKVFPANLRDSSAFRLEIQKSYNFLEQYGSFGSIKKLMSAVEK